MKNKIRFKKEPREIGLASVGAGDPNVNIKINGKVCGYISHPSWNSKDQNIRIRLMIYAQTETSKDWKWIALKYTPADENDAREFLKKYVDEIVEKYDLRYEEE